MTRLQSLSQSLHCRCKIYESRLLRIGFDISGAAASGDVTGARGFDFVIGGGAGDEVAHRARGAHFFVENPATRRSGRNARRGSGKRSSDKRVRRARMLG